MPKSLSMTKHAIYVWKTYVLNSGFKKVNIIANGTGGKGLTKIQEVYHETFYSIVGKIAYTHSKIINKHILQEE